MQKSILIILLFFSVNYAQQAAFVQWTCAEPDSQHVSAIAGVVEGFDQVGGRNFNVYSYNSGVLGPLGLASQRWCPFDGETRFSWGDQAEPVDTQYVQFAIRVKSGFTMVVDSVSMYLGAGGTTDHINTRVLYALSEKFDTVSLISDSSFLPPRDALDKYSYSISQSLTENDTLFVRVYAWYDGSASTSKYLYIQDVNIYGATEAEKTPAAATWELTDPGAGGTGTTVSTSGPVNALEEGFSNMRINQYSGAENSQRTDNRPPGGATEWPASQTVRIDSVYLQFTVNPKAGAKFSVKNISFRIGGNSTNYMKAEVLYSVDSTFSSYSKIPDSLVLEGSDYAYPGHLLRADSLRGVSFDLDTLVDSGEKFYLRFYPWVNDQTSGLTGKYLLLKNLVISGAAEGTIVYDLPTIVTNNVTYISTTFATSGANISSDGGAPVTQRGVAWNTNGSPTTADSLTMDGAGSGSFISNISGLEPGTTYYLRAYATNIAGTAYGDEVSFYTYDSIVVPALSTSSVNDILVISAESGGTVISWGGADITARGVAWNTSGQPTIADNKTEDGMDIGSFNSFLYPLEQTTTYYVRAYATNSAGTGYGNEIEFTTLAPQPDVLKIVDPSGNGDYTTVQAAFDDVPDYYTGKYTIFIKSGVYYEKLFLDRNKINVILQAIHPDSVILTYDDYADIAGGTSMSYSVAIDADDFTAVNITFRNTYANDGSAPNQQAVALRVNGDRQSYYNCKLLGYQDTYYTWGGRGTGRSYMKNCYIEGSVDFIFGRNIVLFDSCEIHINRNGGSLTAAATEAESKFGYVFKDCIISNEAVGFDGNAITRFILGRPWQAAPRTVFINTEEPAALDPAGWATWNVLPGLYAEYKCYGSGSDTSGRHAISRQLSDEEAAGYTIENIFARESNPEFAFDWLPQQVELVNSIKTPLQNNAVPEQFDIKQNFPNPFNPETKIAFSVPRPSHVKITLYDSMGKEVLTLVNGKKDAGFYQTILDGRNLSSGIYFYTMKAGTFIKSHKLILLK